MSDELINFTPALCNSELIIIAIPENPPVVILFGSKNTEKPKPITKQPTIIIAIFKTGCHFLLAFIYILKTSNCSFTKIIAKQKI